MPDITILNSGSGFFGIAGETDAGRDWLAENVHGTFRGEVWSDDINYTRDIVVAAQDDGLIVA